MEAGTNKRGLVSHGVKKVIIGCFGAMIIAVQILCVTLAINSALWVENSELPEAIAAAEANKER